MCALIVLTKAPAHLDTCFSQADLVRDLFPQRAVGVLSVLEHHLQLAQLLRWERRPVTTLLLRRVEHVTVEIDVVYQVMLLLLQLLLLLLLLLQRRCRSRVVVTAIRWRYMHHWRSMADHIVVVWRHYDDIRSHECVISEVNSAVELLLLTVHWLDLHSVWRL